MANAAIPGDRPGSQRELIYRKAEVKPILIGTYLRSFVVLASRVGRFAVGVLAVPLLLRAQAPAASVGAQKTMPTRDSLNAITIRGRLLSNYDFASSAASDSVMARKPAAELVRGWVARMRGDRWDVAFGRLNATSDTFFVAFEAHQRKENPDQFDVVTNTPARPDTGYYARASHAIAVAQADFGPQQRPYNPAILERPSGQFWVYLMPAQLRSNVFPLGADVRYLVDRDGKTVLAKRRLHQSLIESIPRRDDKAQLVAGTHTAVLDDIPEDTDVFHVLVRQPQVPEFVVTDAFVYHIGLDGVIRVVGRSSELLGDKGKTSP